MHGRRRYWLWLFCMVGGVLILEEDRIRAKCELGHRAKHLAAVPAVCRSENDEEVLRAGDRHVHQFGVGIDEPRLRAVLSVRSREQDDRSFRTLQTMCCSHRHPFPQPVRQSHRRRRCSHSFLQLSLDQSGLSAERRDDSDQLIRSDSLIDIGRPGVVNIKEVRVFFHDPCGDHLRLSLIAAAGTLPGVIGTGNVHPQEGGGDAVEP